jgi:hypothetical protein
MAYFNHAFQKAFVGTSAFTALDEGVLGTANNVLATGEFAFVDPKTWEVQPTAVGALACPLVLAAGSLYQNDKIGPFHGGYQESNKSKTINPKYISRFYRVDACEPQASQVTVGLNQINFEDPGSCSKEFFCGETYYLRLDVKGSPVLRTLSRNTYYTADAYTGCCPEDAIAPVAVNPLIVYANWAYNLVNSPLISPFVNVQITYSTDGGGIWEQLAPSAATVDNGVPVPAGATTDLAALAPYIQGTTAWPEAVVPADTLAGLIINGGYIDTRFGDCTFYPNDSLLAHVEPVKIYASEVDYNGDPCAFTGLCSTQVCLPVQGTGFGENIIREVIQSEMYSQNYFYTGMDLRIREITQGYDVSSAIDRTSSYTRYYIQHSVPRFNNPTGTFDNDQYLLEIITDGVDGTFEAFVEGWIANAQGTNCVELDIIGCFGVGEACTAVEAVSAP